VIKRCVQNNRLVYYMRRADSVFWEQHWKRHFPSDIHRRAKHGKLGDFERPFAKWLPRRGCILEAGCGLGQLVLALQVRGYEVEGVEWAEEIVRTVKNLHPNLPIRVGDVRKLDVPDNYYAGYISLGVMEHSREGPEAYLKEAHRVLQPGGILLASVPHFHALRRLKARLGFYRDNTEGLEFYQYAFLPDEFCDIVEACGFKILEIFYYDPFKGIRDEIEIPLLRWLLNHRFISRGLAKLLNILPYANRFGHMFLVVAQASK